MEKSWPSLLEQTSVFLMESGVLEGRRSRECEKGPGGRPGTLEKTELILGHMAWAGGSLSGS